MLKYFTSWTKRYHHKKSTNYRESLQDIDHYVSLFSQITTDLEEVVFEEVPHGLVSGNVPPGVEVEVQDVEPGDEDEGGELGLVADGDQHHEERAHQVLDDLHCRHLEAEESEEHEDQEDPAGKLQVHFRLVLSQTWHLRSRKTVESTITQLG